ncbi:putative ABC transport system ATP-binding protein [Lachnospiraceae bacterium NK3A20]|nr:putative ABC transport system ATP-binding protein [Lachnospiraceae bacterium NK3A20]
MTNIIHLEKIVKKFYIGTENELEVLHGIDLDITKGEFTSIVGESGSGKSTLMNIIGLLDRPTSGTYEMLSVDVSNMRDDDLARVRSRQVGFVFQTYNLIPRMSALKNVEVPLLYAGISQAQRTERAEELLEMVGMADRMLHQPDELSGGQKQRVAIARAMANDPAIILADEPTGALDSKTSRLIMDLFHKLHDEQGKTILLITHSQPLADETGRILTLVDGQVVGERRGTHAH